MVVRIMQEKDRLQESHKQEVQQLRVSGEAKVAQVGGRSKGRREEESGDRRMGQAGGVRRTGRQPLVPLCARCLDPSLGLGSEFKRSWRLRSPTCKASWRRAIRAPRRYWPSCT